MKTSRLAVLALAAALSSAFAQTAPTKPAPKAAAKPAPKAAAPAPAPMKPKPKLMTRDELRACMDRQEANKAEASAIEADDKTLAPERDVIMADAEKIKTRDAELAAEQKTLVAERDALNARRIEIETQIKEKKIDRKQAEAASKEFTASNDAFNTKLDAHNASLKVFREVRAQMNLDARIEAFNQRKEALSTRLDKLGDAQDAWRAECGNRPYDEADEIAIKKERAAKAAGK